MSFGWKELEIPVESRPMGKTPGEETALHQKQW
jgi:hypothetical protein